MSIMVMSSILVAAAVVGIVGIVIAVLLCFAGEKFKVEVDEKEIQVREALPGNNCGGCGFPGCDGLATAIVSGDAPVNACPVGGEACANKIAAIMGQDAVQAVKQAAFVHCGGTCELATTTYEYVGPKQCSLAMNNPGGGPKACTYGCLGFGDCAAACPFDAINIIDGIAQVDIEKCKACGKCVSACPRHLIDLIPVDHGLAVACSSRDKGIEVKKACKQGCLGCGLCARNCPAQAITVENQVAKIDYSLCTSCGLCQEKCPTKCIINKNLK